MKGFDFPIALKTGIQFAYLIIAPLMMVGIILRESDSIWHFLPKIPVITILLLSPTEAFIINVLVDLIVIGLWVWAIPALIKELWKKLD